MPPRQVEYRKVAQPINVSDDGVFSGYASVFHIEDDRGSIFMPGAFAKTLQERSGQIKICRNHDTLIGSPLSMVEDERGLFVTGRINLATQMGAETYSLLKAGDLDGMSIAFVSLKETRSETGKREIREAKLFEFGPVDFPANESALITDVRQMEKRMAELDGETRATDFGQTLTDQQLREGHWRLQYALTSTLNSVWFTKSDGETVALLDSAIADFHAAYLEWANAFIAAGMSRDYLSSNRIEAETRAWMDGCSPEAMAAKTTFTADEIQSLLRGNAIELRGRETELPEPLREAHSKQRAAHAAELFSALRSTFTVAEKRRMFALLQSAAEPQQSDLSEIRSALQSLQSTIGAMPK